MQSNTSETMNTNAPPVADAAVNANGGESSNPQEQSAISRAFDRLFAEGEANRELQRTDPEAYRAKMEAMLPETTCCFCRETFRGYGHNPWPVLEEGRACDTCNRRIVLTARLQAMRDREM